MQSSRPTPAPFWLLVLLVTIASGFVHEIIFHEKIYEDGNFFTFRSHIPDTSAIAQLGPFSKICYRGVWRIYAEKNYMSYITFRGSASKTGILTCYNGPINFQSVHHHIASESTKAALSLYKNGSVSGPEILLTANELSRIEMPVESYAVSAAGRWTVFEGQYFTGNSACLPVVTGDRYVSYASQIKDLNLTKVGSVLKTCDPAQIRIAVQKYNANV